MQIRVVTEYLPGKMDIEGWYCPNPNCSITEVTLRFYEAESDYGRVLFQIVLDYKTWTLRSTEIFMNDDDYPRIIHDSGVKSQKKQKPT